MKSTYLGNAEADTIENLYQQYLQNNNSVDIEWQRFFEGFEFARKNYGETTLADDEDTSLHTHKELKVIALINEYRKTGHLFTKTNPVRKRRSYRNTVDLRLFGLDTGDLNTEFEAGNEIGIGKATLQEIINRMQKTYCASIGVEFMYIRDPDILGWLQEKMENVQNIPDFDGNKKQHILHKLKHAIVFESFLQKKNGPN